MSTETGSPLYQQLYAETANNAGDRSPVFPDPHYILQEFDHQLDEGRLIPKFEADMLDSLRPGFKMVGSLDPSQGEIFDKRAHANQEFEYGRFVTSNGVIWRLAFDMNQVDHYPLQRNFLNSHKEKGLQDVDLSELFENLRSRKIPCSSTNGSALQHLLIEFLVDENHIDFLEAISGETVQADESVFSFVEPGFENFQAPDRIFIWPRIGVFIMDVYQRKSTSKLHTSQKTQQFRRHIQGFKSLFEHLYGPDIDPHIVPILLKFRLNEQIKNLVIRPYIKRHE